MASIAKKICLRVFILITYPRLYFFDGQRASASAVVRPEFHPMWSGVLLLPNGAALISRAIEWLMGANGRYALCDVDALRTVDCGQCTGEPLRLVSSPGGQSL